MYAVTVQADAVAGAPADGDWIRMVSRRSGLAEYELRTRLRVLDGWPGVLATRASEASAGTMADALRACGLSAWVTPHFTETPGLYVLSFIAEGGLLKLELAHRGRLEVPVENIRGLLHGTRFDGHFLLAYGSDLPLLSFQGGILRYATIGDPNVDPTRVAHFKHVVKTLRQACPLATYDQRLCRRMYKSRLLGPMLRPPDLYLDVAIAMLLRRSGHASPYR
ncbi:MAG: hypothetical protein AAF799_14860 [Myxococcota bacterium]